MCCTYMQFKLMQWLCFCLVMPYLIYFLYTLHYDLCCMMCGMFVLILMFLSGKRKRSYVLCWHRTIDTDDADHDDDDTDDDGMWHGSVSISQRATVDAHRYPIEMMWWFCVFVRCTVQYCTVVSVYWWRILHAEYGCIVITLCVLIVVTSLCICCDNEDLMDMINESFLLCELCAIQYTVLYYIRLYVVYSV